MKNQLFKLTYLNIIALYLFNYSANAIAISDLNKEATENVYSKYLLRQEEQTQPQSTQLDILQGAVYQLAKDVIWDDAVDCYQYGSVLYYHIIDGIKLIGTSPLKTAKEWSLIAHKGPIVFKECWEVYNDTLDIYNLFTNDYDILSLSIDFGLNVLFNMGDIISEVKQSSVALSQNDYKTFGHMIGKIVSDIFIKNPLDVAWNLNNSDIFMAMPPPENVLSTQVQQMVSDFNGKRASQRVDQKSQRQQIALNSLTQTLKQEKLKLQEEKHRLEQEKQFKENLLRAPETNKNSQKSIAKQLLNFVQKFSQAFNSDINSKN
ncbi:UNKNOWN [Stylonychia lemnae]|uniref:Uncharacterized protein n=1 Tax=Stylonychia lemnae TaxID=5949 RepID=A0A078BDX6_STYLE|nr:UNKNOWN [Stylonychia lemnae]|eukprot:CDW91367.1 UNKNOWN [Stylonychia lemnae]